MALTCPERVCQAGDHCHKSTLCGPRSVLKYRTLRWWYEAELAESRARRIAQFGWRTSDLEVEPANAWEATPWARECRHIFSELNVEECIMRHMLLNEQEVTTPLSAATPDYQDAIARAARWMDDLYSYRNASRVAALDAVLRAAGHAPVPPLRLPKLEGIVPPSMRAKCSWVDSKGVEHDCNENKS